MDTLREVLGVLFVFGLLGGALWALRRGAGPIRMLRGGNRPAASLRILERVVLTPQHSMHVVCAGSTEWVLVTHPQGCNVISQTAGQQQSREAGA